MIEAKAVYQYDLDGNYVNEYPSANQAKRATGINSTNISRVCTGSLDTKGAKRHVAGGYQWSFVKLEKMKKVLTQSERMMLKAKHKENQVKIKAELKAFKKSVSPKIKSSTRKITQKKDNESYHQYTMDGIYIRSFDNAEDVMKYIGNGYNKKVLSRACMQIIPSAYGFQWRYYEEQEIGRVKENIFS